MYLTIIYEVEPYTIIKILNVYIKLIINNIYLSEGPVHLLIVEKTFNYLRNLQISRESTL